MKLGDTFIGKRLIVGDPTIPGGPVGLGRGKAELRGVYVEHQ